MSHLKISAMRVRWAMLIAAALCLSVLCGCSEFESESISFKVIATTDGTTGFTAYYIIDARDPRITSPALSMGSLVFSETEINNEFDQIQITATRQNLTQTLSIIIYKDDEEVKQTTLETNNSAYTLTLTYEYGEEKSDDTSSSSSSSN